jgi:hypothetical protein
VVRALPLGHAGRAVRHCMGWPSHGHVIRAPSPDELARWIASSWLRSYNESAWAKICTPPDYWEAEGHGGLCYHDGHRRLISSLVARSVVLVSQVDEGPLADGWICGWPVTTLHYLYVRKSARHRGVARSLCAALELEPGKPVRYSHRGPNISHHPRGWTFDPYLLTIQPPEDTHGHP